MGMSAPGNTTPVRESLTSGENRESIKPFLDRGASDKLDDENNLTFTGTRANMPAGQKPVNLDNSISARPSVQVPRIIQTENGCEVTLVFRQTNDPKVRKEIAAMLLDAFRQRKDKEYEASVVPVQSFNQGSGR